MNAKKMPAFPSVTRPKGQFLCFIRQKIIILWMENFYLSCLSKMFPPFAISRKQTARLHYSTKSFSNKQKRKAIEPRSQPHREHLVLDEDAAQQGPLHQNLSLKEGDSQAVDHKDIRLQLPTETGGVHDQEAARGY